MDAETANNLETYLFQFLGQFAGNGKILEATIEIVETLNDPSRISQILRLQAYDVAPGRDIHTAVKRWQETGDPVHYENIKTNVANAPYSIFLSKDVKLPESAKPVPMKKGANQGANAGDVLAMLKKIVAQQPDAFAKIDWFFLHNAYTPYFMTIFQKTR